MGFGSFWSLGLPTGEKFKLLLRRQPSQKFVETKRRNNNTYSSGISLFNLAKMSAAIENANKLKNYILSPELSIHEPLPDIIPRKYNALNLLHLPRGPASTKLVPKRDFVTGEITSFVEVDLEDVGANANNSTSMRREPGHLDEATRGSAMNFPFWPGGLDEPTKEIKRLEVDGFEIDGDLLITPPGFKTGYDFSKHDLFRDEALKSYKAKAVENVNLLQNLEEDLDVQEWLKITQENVEDQGKSTTPPSEFKDVDDHIMASELKPVLEISTAKDTSSTTTEWAEMLDISQPITDFHERIPCPAWKFPFELDTFQKQAIIKLEERQYVFVAAHTSAGKTVVAEYAIGLSKRDLTRTIYTSPIKALSNQKYRDFKKSFQDVGLITGDLQIDPTASCLIMTTEILRSMLYCGSDITRDLEYVIFDEVHYINNPERGHVWEEVIILLPDHVNIIMLSATVPNTMELANWVGSTKKRKVYVVSTLKRPVPLMHYLYTGSGGKSKNDIFLIVDEQGRFLQDNYMKAVEKKTATQSKCKQGSGPKNQTTSPKQDQTTWIGLIDFLKRNDNMPVVAFTLSRKRCDMNAQALNSIDLNTAREKGAVEIFFQQCLSKLKPPDRVLPQVLQMKNSLGRGIGVHHSGILPILKEIVEMLFQDGLVKVLFATETFAMGINMPARTVIFDSQRKFDGTEVRNLKPGEYIQMAGRAGRRGHDKHGCVILLCKTSVPPAQDLRSIILGKPEKLESQFIIRYAVILTCLRIESIKVEDIMMFTFKEFNQKLQLPAQQKQLEVAQNKFSQMPELGEHLQPLCKFYDSAAKYITEKQGLMKFLLAQPKIVKELKVGRVVLVSKGKHYNKLGVLLSSKAVIGKNTTYRVLVLDHQFKNIDKDEFYRGDGYYKMVSLSPQFKFFHPEGTGGHTILDLQPADIVEITKTALKIDADTIIRNWEQRQIERFKDSPPGASFIKLVTELQQLNEDYIQNPQSLKFVNIYKEINVNADTEMAQIHYLEHLSKQLQDVLPHTNIAGFEQEFAIVYERKVLEHRIEELKFKNSTKNLSLYPDYCNKLEVLRALKYIDEFDEVTLKGKIACEMGQNELLITELILCNMFNDLEPAEIAALLSGLVFGAKIQGQPVIPEKLKKCVKEFEEISNNILAEELRHHAVVETEERLNFGLLEVVYEWARNKPFAEIMKLTEIQEGIIVRCIQQLDETIRDVKTAAIRIGNPALQTKMEEASNTIKRDIVFTASLYTTF